MQIPKDFSFNSRHVGHTHFLRDGMSRRDFIARAVTGTAVITSPLWRPAVANAAASDPTPIPQTIPGTPFHFDFPGPPPAQGEPSTINNFRGVIGVAMLGGQGTGTNTDTGATERLLFDIDNRFMKGVYVGAGGQTYEATFAFV